MQTQWSEFYGSAVAQLAPFTTTAIGTGTAASVLGVANHPGIWRIASGAGANTGHIISSGGITSVLIGGGEIAEFIVSFPTTTALIAILGFDDTAAIGAATDGAYIQVTATSLDGRTRNNGVTSQTATSFTITANTWYRAKVVVNSTATQVDFYLYDSTGALLWTDLLTTNIPTAAGRETCFSAKAYKTTITAANMMDLDWMSYSNTKVLVR